MPDWATFAGFAGVVLLSLLGLAYASASVVRDDNADPSAPSPRPDAADPYPATFSERVVDAPSPRTARPSTAAMLANVAVSQGIFASLLLLAAWYTSIPAAALGVDVPTLDALALGIALGLTLFAVNELGTYVGLGGGETLRTSLAPDTAVGWAALLLLVLPLVAGFEELLFRGVLVGAVAAGFGVSPWLLAVLSSVAFALGHGAQGPTGVVVTGLFGFVLAAAFVLTGSLLVVVVAHYLVNALEFLVNEA
jgi:membrane protease YdiL (CAAX protease family)